MNRKRRYEKPLCYVAQDAQGNTLQSSWIDPSTDEWAVAQRLLKEEEVVKRVIFFDHHFTFVNVLSRPNFLKHDDDVIVEEDKRTLLHKKQEQSYAR